MYLARLLLNKSRRAVLWVSNPYRVHQRLKMAYEGEPRLLFRIEELDERAQIIIQTGLPPDWERAFGEFLVLAASPESRAFDPHLVVGKNYRFRLLANPTVKKTVIKEQEPKKARVGLRSESDQIAWLERKLTEAGARLLGCNIRTRGLQFSRKNPRVEEGYQTHQSVLYEGILHVEQSQKLESALAAGIGPAKGYGFGLLSLALA